MAWSQPYERSPVLDPNISFKTLGIEDGQIHYAHSGDIQKPGILFIHGTPGGWDAFEDYLSNPILQKDYFVVSVDRPGWGKSIINNKKLTGNFKHQASSIAQILEHYPNKKWTIIGHSLGASLAPEIALQAPESVNSLLLLAGSLSPRLGSPRWYNYAAKTWIVSKMVGQTMTNANREIMKLGKQLKLMSNEIDNQKSTTNVLIIQGSKDKLVSPKNPSYAIQEWSDNFATLDVIELAGSGHFLPWQQSGVIIRAINNLNQQY